MAFNLDSLTVDSSKRQEIFTETNSALKSYAKNAQSQLSELQQTNRDLREIESSEFMVDKIADQQASSNILNMVDASRSALSGLDGALGTLEQTMATQVGRLVELQDVLSRPNDLDSKTRRQAEREFKQIDRQAYKTQQTLNAARQEKALIQQTTAQAVEQYAARHSISKQARDNNEAVARTMSLRNQQAAVDDKLKADGSLVQIIQSRQTLSPGEGDQKARDGMDVFKFMYFSRHNGENMDKYGVEQARQEQALYSAMTPDEQRAAQFASRAFTVAEVTGTPLNIAQYKQQLAEDGEVGSLEVVAKMSGDTDLVDAINVGRNAMFSSMYEQQVAAETAKLTPAEAVTGLSDQRLRQIQAGVQQQLSGMNAKDILSATRAVVNQDMNSNTSAKGQDIFSRVAESGIDELLSPLMFSPEVREYFKSPEAVEIMTIPNMKNGSPLLETTARLVESMRGKGFSGPEAISAVSNLTGQASKAAYKTRADFGNNAYATHMQTLERLGYDINPPVLVPVPRSRFVPPSRTDVSNYNLANPTDFQAAIEDLKKFSSKRERVDALQQNPAPSAQPQVNQYGLPVRSQR